MIYKLKLQVNIETMISWHYENNCAKLRLKYMGMFRSRIKSIECKQQAVSRPIRVIKGQIARRYRQM